MGILSDRNDYQLVFELEVQDQAKRNSIPFAPTHWRFTITEAFIGSHSQTEGSLMLTKAGSDDSPPPYLDIRTSNPKSPKGRTNPTSSHHSPVRQGFHRMWASQDILTWPLEVGWLDAGTHQRASRQIEIASFLCDFSGSVCIPWPADNSDFQ